MKKKRKQPDHTEDAKPLKSSKILIESNEHVEESPKSILKKPKTTASEEKSKQKKKTQKTFNDDDEVIEFGDTDDVDEGLMHELRHIIETGGSTLSFDEDGEDQDNESNEKEETKELDGSRAIYVKNIPYQTTESDLKKMFRRCGKIMAIK